MVTDVDGGYSADAGAFVGAGVGARDAIHVESGKTIVVTTMATSMTLTLTTRAAMTMTIKTVT